MSAVTVTLANVCSGGNHLTFSVTGDATLSRVVDRDRLLDPLTEADVQSFLRCIAWMAKNGRTFAQARALLQAGVTVTV